MSRKMRIVTHPPKPALEAEPYTYDGLDDLAQMGRHLSGRIIASPQMPQGVGIMTTNGPMYQRKDPYGQQGQWQSVGTTSDSIDWQRPHTQDPAPIRRMQLPDWSTQVHSTTDEINAIIQKNNDAARDALARKFDDTIMNDLMTAKAQEAQREELYRLRDQEKRYIAQRHSLGESASVTDPQTGHPWFCRCGKCTEKQTGITHEAAAQKSKWRRRKS